MAAAWGVSTASYSGAVGPHTAQYSATLNGEITFDMGPLGSLILDSPLPFHLGVDIHVQQIPADLTVAGLSTAAAGDQAIVALTADLQRYTQFFNSPNEAILTAAKGLGGDALSRTFLMWSILLTAILLGRLAAHGVMRAAIASAWRRPGVPAVALTLSLVCGTLLIIPATQGSAGAGMVSSVLAGTPVEDARITGRLRLLIDHYGQYVIDEIDKNQNFYADVTAHLRTALDADGEVTGPRDGLVPMPTVEPEPEPAHEGDQLALDHIDDSAGAEDPVTLLVVSDLHCNIGMGEVAGVIAREVEAELILNLGDNVIGGTSVEGFCIDSFAESFGEIPVVVANGNHDSQETADQERAHGWEVLDGEPIEIAGLRILGDADPTLTSLGAPTRQVADESHVERGARMTAIACAERDAGTPVDLLLMHNHRSTEEALDSGCVTYAFAGHFHRRIGPWQRGFGVQYLNTSSAGATLNKPTIGPLSGTAGITVVIWDRATNSPFAMRVIRAFPDTTVDLSPWYSWPEPANSAVHDEWPTLEDAPWE